MVTEAYCDFETAKLLKEKGFDVVTNTSYVVDNYKRPFVKVGDFLYNRPTEPHLIAAPSLALTMKWLREKHKLFIDITAAMEDYIEDGVVKYKDPYYTWEVFSLEIGETLCFGEAQNVKKSYEEACEAAIKYCLENLI